MAKRINGRWIGAKKAEHRSPKTEIEPGQRIGKKTEFKKGFKPWNAGTRTWIHKECGYCGKKFKVPKGQTGPSKFCSIICRSKFRSELGPGTGPGWKGGRATIAGCYIGIYDPANPMAMKTGYVLEHRLVMSGVVGRILRKDETVHHINGDTRDNRPENLELRQGRHGRGIVYVCLDCGSHNVGPRGLN